MPKPAKYVRDLLLDLRLKAIIDYRSLDRQRRCAHWAHNCHSKEAQRNRCHCIVYAEEMYKRSLNEPMTYLEFDYNIMFKG